MSLLKISRFKVLKEQNLINEQNRNTIFSLSNYYFDIISEGTIKGANEYPYIEFFGAFHIDHKNRTLLNAIFGKHISYDLDSWYQGLLDSVGEEIIEDRNEYKKIMNAFEAITRLFDDINRKKISLDFLSGKNYHLDSCLKEWYYKTNSFHESMLFANGYLYNCIRILRRLAHPCDICASDINSWETRRGFCPHNPNSF